MSLSESDKSEYYRLFEKANGVSPDHVSIKSSHWKIGVWNNDDIASIVNNPRCVDEELIAIEAEAANTERNTIVKPVLYEVNASWMRKPINYEETDNILTLGGMTNMAELSTADSTKTNTHCYFGDDSTPAEAVTDTILNNQLLAKEFDTVGDRITVDQTERYAMAAFRSDFGSDVILKEAGIGTGTTPPTDILTAHVIFADKPVGLGQTMTVQIAVGHKNGTI